MPRLIPEAIVTPVLEDISLTVEARSLRVLIFLVFRVLASAALTASAGVVLTIRAVELPKVFAGIVRLIPEAAKP